MKNFFSIVFFGLLALGVAGHVIGEDKHDHAGENLMTSTDLPLADSHDGHDHAAHQNEDRDLHAEHPAHDEHDHGEASIHGGHDQLGGHDHEDHDHLDHGADKQEQHVDAGHEGHDHGDEQTHDAHDEGEATAGHEGHGHDEHGHEEGGINLTQTQRDLANIQVSRVEPRPMPYQVYAPGEIKANAYTSYLVSPRVDSVVLKRHVELGSHVRRGQSLVTLFSADVAEAQASYRINLAEWNRVEKLGRKAIGEKRFVAARNEFISIKSRLKAFGLADKAIARLNKREPKNAGEYTLVATTSGVVLSDDFHQGQRVEAGSALMELVDESKLWVEARISGQNMLEIPRGTLGLIRIADHTIAAQITQEAHAIDPVTRTRVLRLVIDNEMHRFHPGMFADVYLQFMTDEPVIALRESALMRSADGHWVVYVEDHEGEFEAREVELGRMLGDRREVIGLRAGERVVSDGAFFVASQEAKGGFDPHNH